MHYKKIIGLFCSFMLNIAHAEHAVIDADKEPNNHKKQHNDFHISVLYLQPTSNNLDYAYFVSGIQPYYQSWHSQMLQPNYSPAFELGFNFAVPQTTYSASIDWMHLGTKDSSSKQANESLALQTLEFVAPPFEMSPPVFGVKRAESTVNFNFDNITLNMNKLFTWGSRVQATVFGGLNIIHVGQTVTTTFSDFPGAIPTAYSYSLPADPNFSMQLKSQSKYIGAGPDLGLNVKYNVIHGFGLVGQASGMVSAGTTSTQELFTGTSNHLTSLGIGTGRQQITTPNKTQVVPGVDGKLGVFYNYAGSKIANLTLEGGYRILSYLNAITTINPGTLVQPGTVNVTPDFATGTMAIVSVLKQDRPFNLNGLYLDLKLAMD